MSFCGGYVGVILSNSSFFFNFFFFIFLFFFFIFLFFKKNKQTIFLFSIVLVFCFLTVLYKQYGALFGETNLLNDVYKFCFRRSFNVLFDFSGPGLLHGISFLTACCFFFYNTVLYGFNLNLNPSKRFLGFFTKTSAVLFISVYVLLTGAYWAYFSAVWGNWYNNDIIEVFYIVFFIAGVLYLHAQSKPYLVFRLFSCFFFITVIFLALLRFGLLNTKHTSAVNVSSASFLWFFLLVTLVFLRFYYPLTAFLKQTNNMSNHSNVARTNSGLTDTSWLSLYNTFIFFFATTIVVVAFTSQLFLFFYFSYINFFFFFFVLSVFISFTKLQTIKTAPRMRWKNFHLTLVAYLLVLLFFVWGLFAVNRLKSLPSFSTSRVAMPGYYGKNTHLMSLTASHTNTHTTLAATAFKLNYKKLTAVGNPTLYSYDTIFGGVQSDSRFGFKKTVIFFDTVLANNENFSIKDQICKKINSFYKQEYDLIFFVFNWFFFLLLFI